MAADAPAAQAEGVAGSARGKGGMRRPLRRPVVFRVVFRITGDVEQSEQIVQEALLKVWEDRDSWIVIENLPSYCMMVARNLALRETYSGDKERMERYAVR